MSRRVDINVLLKAIAAEAECAQRRAKFGIHVEHIHRLVAVVESRMKSHQLHKKWSQIDRMMAELEPYDDLFWPAKSDRKEREKQRGGEKI